MFIVFRGKAVHLARGNDGFYRDALGTIFALRDDSDTMDLVDRCGIAPFAIPTWFERITRACKPHDYKYSSFAYQAFYTRAEADAELERDVRTMAAGDWWRILGAPFRWIATRFGGEAWENKDTR